METDNATRAALALLAVVAVVLTATTLPSAIQQTSGSGSGPPGGGSGDGALYTPPPRDSGAPTGGAWLVRLLGLIVLAAVILAVAYAFVHRRALFRTAVAVAAGSVVLVLLLYLLPFSFGDATLNAAVGSQPPNQSLGGSGDVRTDQPSLFLPALALLAVPLLVGAAVAASRLDTGGGTEDADDPDIGSGDAGETATAVARTASTAADRIEAGGDVDNEVYRAWQEMTRLLEVPEPETTTPREFERAAVEAGFERTDVAALTDLFETVRYGDCEAGPAEAERAVTLLRRIEAHAEEDG